MVSAESPPTASPAASTRTGRIRFPPANRLYRTARWMVAGHFVSEGSARSRAASTSARSPSSVASRSGVRSGLIVGPGHRLRLRPAFLVEDRLPAGVLHEHLDLALGLLELAVAQAGEPDAVLVELQGFLEGQLALLELLHD